MKVLSLQIFVLLTSLLLGCGGSSADPTPERLAPKADAGNDMIADENSIVDLDASNSSDSDGTIVNYSWAQTSGAYSVDIDRANESKASFRTPDVDSNIDLTFKITVTDNDNLSDSDSVNVIVNRVNQKPVVNVQASSNVTSNDRVLLDGRSSYDPDGEITEFYWTQIGNPQVNINNANKPIADFTAPDVSIPSPLTFQLSVIDNDGASDSKKTEVLIVPSNTVPRPNPIFTELRTYIFGHSLILHEAKEYNDFTNVPRWMHELSSQAGYSYAMSGQYGFGHQHVTNLPPDAQWDVEGVTRAAPRWRELDSESFADYDFNVVMFTAANFRQRFPADQVNPNWPDITTETTATLFNWVRAADPNIKTFVIYENWADMRPYTSADFSNTFPTPDELKSYWDFVQGNYHEWWINYQDVMLEQHPDLNIRMIPVGPILGKLLTGTLADIQPANLYEDVAPHGRATLYFLAGLITYMGTYGTESPSNYIVPDNVDALVRDNYPQIVMEIWLELQNFNDASGKSRVFSE